MELHTAAWYDFLVGSLVLLYVAVVWPEASLSYPVAYVLLLGVAGLVAEGFALVLRKSSPQLPLRRSSSRSSGSTGATLGAFLVPLGLVAACQVRLDDSCDGLAAFLASHAALGCILVAASAALGPSLTGSMPGGFFLSLMAGAGAYVLAESDEDVLLDVFAASLGALLTWSAPQLLPNSLTMGESMVLAQLLSVVLGSALLDGLEPDSNSLARLSVLATGLLVGGVAQALLSAWTESAHFALQWAAVALPGVAGVVGVYHSSGLNIVAWLVWEQPTFSTARIWLTLYWLAVLLVFIPLAKSSSSRLPPPVVRKLFHAAIVLVLAPGVLVDPEYTQIATAGALIGMLGSELVRLANDPALARLLDAYTRSFRDERDAGPMILTPLYLLFGCAYSIWLYGLTGPSLFALSGTAVLGVADALAAVLGKRFGKATWPGLRRTYVGSLAALLSLVAFTVALAPSYDRAFVYALAAAALTALAEAWLHQIDNLFLPLIHLALLSPIPFCNFD